MLMKLTLSVANKIEQVEGTVIPVLEISVDAPRAEHCLEVVGLGRNQIYWDPETWCSPPLRPVEGSAPLCLFGSPHFLDREESPLPAVAKKVAVILGFVFLTPSHLTNKKCQKAKVNSDAGDKPRTGEPSRCVHRVHGPLFFPLTEMEHQHLISAEAQKQGCHFGENGFQ